MTPSDIQKMRDQRVKLIADARTLLEKAEGDSRDLDAEERQQYDKQFEDAATLGDRITRAEKLVTVEAEMATSQGRRSVPAQPDTSRDPTQPETRTNGTARNREFRYILQPDRVAPRVERVIEMREDRSSDEYNRSFRRYLQSRTVDNVLADQIGRRDVSADSQVAGGGVVPSEEFIAKLVKFVDDSVFVRQLATVFRVGRADSLGAPSYDTDPADADWTSEVPSSLVSDTTQTFGKRELHPYIATKLIKASRKILRVSSINLEQFVRERLGFKLAITHEKAFLTGTGANQPLGVFTADAKGISTSRDVSTGNTTTTIGADGLIEAKYALKAQYRSRNTTRWMFHRDGVKQVSKLKDADGQYLWRPGLVANDPDQILGMSVMESEFAPNTFTTGLYVGILGDWMQYWIADSLDMEILRLDERYSDTLQVGFQLMASSDGMPVIEEAFARVTLA